MSHLVECCIRAGDEEQHETNTPRRNSSRRVSSTTWMTVSRLSIELQLLATKINEMLLERGRINANTVLRLVRFFDTIPRFWLKLQTSFDLKQAETSLGDKIKNEIQPLKLPLKLGG